MNINWLLIVVLFIIAFFAYRGYKMGLMRILFSVVSVIITLVISVVLTPYVSSVLYSNEALVKNIEEKVQSTLKQKEDTNTNINTENSEESLEQIMGQVGIPKIIQENILKQDNLSNYPTMVKEMAYQHISSYIAIFILNSASFIIVYIITRIVVSIIFRALNIVSRLPVINTLNKLSGFVLGTVQGLIIIWVGCVFINIFSSTEMVQEIYRCIEENQLLQYIYNNNLLLDAINDIGEKIQL